MTRPSRPITPISLAINRQSIVDALFEGSRMPATSIMPTSIDDSPEST